MEMKCRALTSRKNEYIRHLRQLQNDRKYRREHGEFLCDGAKLLEEALSCGAEVVSVLWKEKPSGSFLLPEGCAEYSASAGLFDYVSPMKNSPGPVFSVRIPENAVRPVNSAIVLENVQDPGNVGTVLRTASAFGIGAVVFCGECADLYNPKTVRSTMGAIFRQYVYFCEDPSEFAAENGLRLYGAALTEQAVDLRDADLSGAAVCIGNEGHGLSGKLLDSCEKAIIIPMDPASESLNAAVAASVIMWEMRRAL